MSSDELLMMKGAITELKEEEQKEVKEAADQIRAIVKLKPTTGLIALALVGLESQDE